MSDQQAKFVERAYVAFQLFFNLLLWVPIFYEFQKRMGLSDPEIFGIQSVYYVAFCLLEIPTGFMADRFGYKSCLLMGAALLVGANLLPVGLPTYAGFMAHFLAIALARSLISGASSAYLYEFLRARGETERYRKIEGDARFWSLVARIVAGAAAGPLMVMMVTLPYWVSAVSAAAALLAAVALPTVSPHYAHPSSDSQTSMPGSGGTDPAFGRTDPVSGGTDPAFGRTDPVSAGTDPAFGRTDPVSAGTDPAGAHDGRQRLPSAHGRSAGTQVGYRAAAAILLRSPRLMLLILQGVGLFVLGRILIVNLFQPLLGSRSFDVTMYGPIMGGMMVCEAVGSRLAHKVRAAVSDRHAVTLMTGFVTITLVGVAYGGQWLTIASLGAFSLATGLAFPVQKQLMNDAIPEPRLRATLLSLESIVDRAVCAVAVLPLGALVAEGRFADILVTSALITAVVALIVHTLMGTVPKGTVPVTVKEIA